MNIFTSIKDRSTTLSMGRVRRTFGYKIKQQPLGKTLQAIERLQDFPAELLKELFPGGSVGSVLDDIRGVDADGLALLIAKALSVAPRMVVDLIAELADIPPGELLEKPEIGVCGLAEIVVAVIEVNRVGEMAAAIRALTQQVKGMFGFKN